MSLDVFGLGSHEAYPVDWDGHDLGDGVASTDKENVFIINKTRQKSPFHHAILSRLPSIGELQSTLSDQPRSYAGPELRAIVRHHL